MHRFSLLPVFAMAASLGAPGAATAQTQVAAKTPCEVEGDLWRADLAARLAGKKGRAKPEANLWYGHSMMGIPQTVAELEAWIARNPGNICAPEARWWLEYRRKGRADAAQRDIAAAQARATRLAALRASPTAGASEARLSRALSITSDDVPPRSQGGTVGYELGVDEVGTVTVCTIVSSASSVLDTATCRLVSRRARFDPARDDKGMPVASRFRGKIAWPASAF